MPAARTGPRPAPPPPAAAATAPDRAGPPPPDRRTRRADREGAPVPQPCAYSPNRHRVNAEGTVQASPVTPAQARPARNGQPATGATRLQARPGRRRSSPDPCATEPDASREDEPCARWATVEQARLAVFSWIACYSHRRRGSALPVVGAGGRPVRPTVVLAGRSLGGLQRRLGVRGPGLGRPGASPLGHEHRGPVPLGVLHHLPGHLGHRALGR